MILVLGGAFQGKKQFALIALKQLANLESEITDGAVCTYEEACQAQVLDHFHLLVKRGLDQGWDLDALAERFLQSAKEEGRPAAVISNELGCGIVPVEKADRLWREKTGRLLTRLSAGAQQVYRVVAGLGMPLK